MHGIINKMIIHYIAIITVHSKAGVISEQCEMGRWNSHGH